MNQSRLALVILAAAVIGLLAGAYALSNASEGGSVAPGVPIKRSTAPPEQRATDPCNGFGPDTSADANEINRDTVEEADASLLAVYIQATTDELVHATVRARPLVGGTERADWIRVPHHRTRRTYSLHTCSITRGEYEVEVSAPGYASQHVIVDATDSRTPLWIELEPASTKLILDIQTTTGASLGHGVLMLFSKSDRVIDTNGQISPDANLLYPDHQIQIPDLERPEVTLEIARTVPEGTTFDCVFQRINSIARFPAGEVTVRKVGATQRDVVWVVGIQDPPLRPVPVLADGLSFRRLLSWNAADRGVDSWPSELKWRTDGLMVIQDDSTGDMGFVPYRLDLTLKGPEAVAEEPVWREIEGKVTDPDGKPVKFASISRLLYEGGDYAVTEEHRSDDRGEFRFRFGSPIPSTFVVRASGFESQRVKLDGGSEVQSVAVELHPIS